LEDWEVHLLWADLRDSHGAEVQADLDEALKRAPNSPEVNFGRGRWQFTRGRLAEAEAEARAGLAKRPRDPKLMLLLGWTLVKREEHAPQDKRNLDAIAPDLEALRAVADSAEALDVIARYEVLRGHDDAAIDYAQRAAAQAPGSWHCQRWLATIL